MDLSVPAATAFVRRLAAPLAALACVGGALAAVGAVDPGTPGRYPACPVPALTGRYCPGCGGLRGAHALAHGDVPAALSANVLVTAGIVGTVAVLLGWLLHAARGHPPRLRRRPGRSPSRRTGRRTGHALLALVAAFTLLRNLPLGAPLAP